MSGYLAILGGCGGIGRALVEASTSQGYRPVVLDIAPSIEAHPVDAEVITVDATDPASVSEAATQLRSNLAGLVCLNGFMAQSSLLTETPDSTWTEVIEGNLAATWRAITAWHGHLGANSAVVLTGSGLGHFARPGYGPYAIAKAGIAALTRQLALELAPRHRVNAVAPSAVDTAFLRGGTGRSDETETPRFDVDAYAHSVPLGRIATAEDIVGPILFLLSPAAAYVTGQTLHVNGGGYMP